MAAAAAHEPTHAQQTIVCGSAPGELHVCAADTEEDVTLVRSLGVGACVLGRTWDCDASGVWVSDGCRAELSVGDSAEPSFGEYAPAQGFKLADTEPACRRICAI